jgi:hypothetical protein
MPFTIFRGEQSIAELVHRLFDIKGPDLQVQMQRASDDLLKANPQLKDLSKLPVGTPIAIPDTLPHVRPEELTPDTSTPRSVATQNIQTAFEHLVQRLNDIDATVVENVKSSLARLQTPQMKAAIKAVGDQQSDMGDLISSFPSAADFNDLLKEIASAQKPRLQAVADLTAALNLFSGTQGRASRTKAPTRKTQRG